LGQLGSLNKPQGKEREGMEDRIEEVFASEITRADFLKRAAATGIGLSLLSGVGAAGALAADTATQTVRWISPRGTLDVMDDFDLWVPVKQDYFSKLGITAKLIGGPIGDALACTKFVAQRSEERRVGKEGESRRWAD